MGGVANGVFERTSMKTTASSKKKARRLKRMDWTMEPGGRVEGGC
jgi:hypothetical protein